MALIQEIARRVDPKLADQFAVDHSNSYPFGPIEDAARVLAGSMDSVEEIERILGPRGPRISAADLHPWIWNAAVDLWGDGHRREAIQAAAQALFDQHLPAKLGVPAAQSAKDLVAQAFSTDPPAASKPRLRLSDYPFPSPSWTSQHEGAKVFGMGCAQLIRNLTTHNSVQPDEQSAHEQLAALSVLARLIDRAQVQR